MATMARRDDILRHFTTKCLWNDVQKGKNLDLVALGTIVSINNRKSSELRLDTVFLMISKLTVIDLGKLHVMHLSMLSRRGGRQGIGRGFDRHSWPVGRAFDRFSCPRGRII